MEINNNFEVPLPPRDAWKTLLDIPRIAPCMPGAELTGVLDKDTYNGKVSVRLGPVALTFAGQVKFTDIDEAGYRARVKAQGKDSKGRDGAKAAAAAKTDFRVSPYLLGVGEHPSALVRCQSMSAVDTLALRAIYTLP